MRVVITNLSWSTRTDSLQDFLSSCDGFIGAEIRLDTNGRSRGMGFATFGSSAQAAAAVKALSGKELNGRVLQLSQDSKSSPSPPSTSSPSPSKTTSKNSAAHAISTADKEMVMKTGALYIAGLAEVTDDASLRDYFGREGSLEDCVVLRDRQTGVSRQCGFVTFSLPSVALSMLTRPHFLDGVALRVRPRNNDPPRGGGGGAGTGAGGGLRGGGLSGRNDDAAVLFRCDRRVEMPAIEGLFKRDGKIQNIRLFPQREKDRGCNGIVQFAAAADARKAVAKHSGRDVLPGISITMRVASDPRPTPASRDARGAGTGGAKGRGEGRAGVRDGGNGRDGDERGNGVGGVGKVKKLYLSQHEIETLHFFRVYVDNLKGDDKWVKLSKDKRKGKMRMMKEMQSHAEKPTMSLAQLMDFLSLGSKFVGGTRAKLLLDWYTLLQASEKADAYEFFTPSGMAISFKQAFVLSPAIEHLVMKSLEYPFESPIPADALPSTCRLTVPMLVSRIFLKTMVGGPEVHATLLQAVAKLGTLNTKTIPATLKNNIGRLAACFKADVSGWENPGAVSGAAGGVGGGAQQSLELRRLYRQQLGLSTPTIEDLPPPGMNRHLAAAEGYASADGVRGVFEGLSEEIGEIAKTSSSTMAKARAAVERLDADVAAVKTDTEEEERQVDAEIATLERQEEAINQRKAGLKADMKRLVDEMNVVSSEVQSLQSTSDETSDKFDQLVAKMHERRAAVQANAEAADARASKIQNIRFMLERTHAAMSAQVRPTSVTDLGMSEEEFAAFAASTVRAVHAHAMVVLGEVQKKFRKLEFCNGKLASMQRERRDMQDLGFIDVAIDLERGIEKMNAERLSLIEEVRVKIGEIDFVGMWFASVKETRLLDAALTAPVDAALGEFTAMQAQLDAGF